jgi:hypothetical protein
LRGHLRFLALHPNFPRLQQLPFLGKALGTDSERLHLHFQLDPLAPEKLSPLFVRIACWLQIGVVLLSLLVMLLLMVVVMKLRLVVRKGTFFLLCLPYAHHSRLTDQSAAEKKAESALHCVFGLFFSFLSPFSTANDLVMSETAINVIRDTGYETNKRNTTNATIACLCDERRAFSKKSMPSDARRGRHIPHPLTLPASCPLAKQASQRRTEGEAGSPHWLAGEASSKSLASCLCQMFYNRIYHIQ